MWSLYKFEGWDLIPVSALQEISTRLSDTTILLKGASLEEGTRYQISVASSQNGILEASSTLVFSTNSKPRDGNCFVSPSEGFVESTSFLFNCTGWIDEELSYTFKYQTGYGPVTFFQGKDPYVSAMMPMGDPSKNYVLEVEMVVEDTLGGTTSVFTTLKVIAIHRF